MTDQRIQGLLASSCLSQSSSRPRQLCFIFILRSAGTSPHCKTGVESRGPPSFSRSLYSSFLCPPPTTCNHQHDCYLCRDSIYMYLLLLRVGSLRGLSKARHRFTHDTIQVSKLVSNTRLDPFYCNKNRLRTHLHFAFHHAISLHLLTRLSTFQKI